MQPSGALLELQTLDIEIMRAEKRLDELPEKRAILEARAKQREVATMAAKAKLLVNKLESELKARQDEITMLTEKIDGEQTKIMETTDHRQVQALTREMDGLKRRVDKLEMESMGFMERIEKANAQVKTIDEAVGKLGEKERALVDRFRQVGGEVQSEIAGFQKRRAAVASLIDAEMLGKYESLRAAKGGIGVGRLEGEQCSACRMALPAEKIRDLIAGGDVGLCPQCRRLIVVRTGDETDE